MAPSLISFESAVQPGTVRMAARADAPACFSQCMSTTSLEGCSPTDLQCLCSSATYITNFSLCLGATCPTTERSAAYDYSEALCLPYTTGNGTSPVDPAAPRATNNDRNLRPNIRHVTAGPINTVMTVICCFLLGVSLVTGFFSIRSKRKREAEMTRDREWTTTGSVSTKDYGMRTKHSAKYQTSSFASTNFGQNSSNFGGDTHTSFALSPIRETARRDGDHWVLGETDEDDKSPGPVTPGASSGFDVQTLDYSADGSRVDLNAPEVAEDKAKGKDAHAI